MRPLSSARSLILGSDVNKFLVIVCESLLIRFGGTEKIDF